MNKVAWENIHWDQFRRDRGFWRIPGSRYWYNLQCFGGSFLDAEECCSTIKCHQVDNDPFATTETYYVDIGFYKSKPKTDQGKEPPITGQITTKAENLLDAYTKPMTQLEYRTVKINHQFNILSKGSGSKPIIFHEMGDMKNHSFSKEEDSKNEIGESIFAPKSR